LGAVHEDPFQAEKALTPTAMQKLGVGHDTRLGTVVAWGVENDVPFHVTGLPVWPTAMQKVDVGHEMEWAGTWYSMDHDVPFQTRMSPSSSGAAQKLAETHDTLVIPSFGSGKRICDPVDHEAPSQRSAPPPAAPAMQKEAVGHAMWL